MTTKKRASPAAGYVVANPRGLPPGAWIVKVDGRCWHEGEPYDGPFVQRFIDEGFVVEVNNG